MRLTTSDSGLRTKRAVTGATGWAINWAAAAGNPINASRSRGRERSQGKGEGRASPTVANIQYALYNGPESKRIIKSDVPAVIGDLRRGLSNESLVDGSWDAVGIPLMINVKGCGYPPYVNCSTFHRLVGNRIGNLLPCYANRRHFATAGRNHNITMAIFPSLDPDRDHMIIILCFIVPVTIFALSVAVLCCWHNQSCRQRCQPRRCWSTRSRTSSARHSRRTDRSNLSVKYSAIRHYNVAINLHPDIVFTSQILGRTD